MNAIFVVVALLIALLYMRRMEQLLYFRNGVSFVLQNAIGAGAGLASALDIATNGVWITHGFIGAMSVLYLIRSRDTYFEEVTKPAPLDEIDDRHLRRISGGRKS